MRTAKTWLLAGGAASLFGGVLLLFISFWVTYGVLWFICFSFRLHLSHSMLLLISGAFMALVSIIGSRQNWDDIDPLKKQALLARDMEITLVPGTRYGMSYNTDAMKAGAFEVSSMASVANYVLCGSVKLVLGGIGRFRAFFQQRPMNVEGCARVLAFLATCGRRQSFEEIVAALPGLNPVQVFEDLRSVDGVLFLSAEPAGLTLNPELRNELLSLGAAAGL